MFCDICGEEITARPTRVRLEGTEMMVCGRCRRFGTQVIPQRRDYPIRRASVGDHPAYISSTRPIEVEDVKFVADYADRIMKARQAKNLTHDDLSQGISESVSVLRRLEQGRMTLLSRTARKLEKFLGITLIEAAGETKTEDKAENKGEDKKGAKPQFERRPRDRPRRQQRYDPGDREEREEFVPRKKAEPQIVTLGDIVEFMKQASGEGEEAKKEAEPKAEESTEDKPEK